MRVASRRHPFRRSRYGKRGGLPGFWSPCESHTWIIYGGNGHRAAYDDDGAGERRTVALRAAARATAGSRTCSRHSCPSCAGAACGWCSRRSAAARCRSTNGSPCSPTAGSRTCSGPTTGCAGRGRPTCTGWCGSCAAATTSSWCTTTRRRSGSPMLAALGPELPAGAAHPALGPAQAPGALRQRRRRRLGVGQRGVVRPARHGAARRCGHSASGTCTCPPRSRSTPTAARP